MSSHRKGDGRNHQKPSARLARRERFLRYLLSPAATRMARRAVVVALAAFLCTSLPTSVSIYRMLHIQQRLSDAYHRRVPIRTDVPARRGTPAGLEAEFTRSVHRVQTLILTENALACTLFAIVTFYLVRDRAERRQQDRRLRQINARLAARAEEDGLTGLKNRRAFEERLREEWARAHRYGEPLSVMLLDVDHFKSYNDGFGHLAGDAALRLVADILRRQARTNDFAARYGGEEFAILLPHTTAASATVAANRIRAAFMATNWPERPITASIGVATLTPATATPEDFVHEADRALYWAKHLGRNRAVHADSTGVYVKLTDG
jgi:diguanylate cyclase (GGDEF)-like protein